MNVTNSSKKIHLYIEKSNPKSGKLLLDFLDVSEFADFIKSGLKHKNTENIDEIPSLIMVDVERIPPAIILYEGGMLTITFRKLLNICLDSEDGPKTNFGVNNSHNKAQILPFLSVIKNQTQFLSLLKDPGTKISQKTPKNYKIPMNKVIDATNQEIIKVLKELIGDNLHVIIFDVGQGSASAVLSSKGGIIYDLGSDAFRSTELAYLKNKLNQIKCATNGINGKVLILSHWDIDHYNLINGIDDNDMKSLKLVLFPTEAFGVYAGRVYARIQANCKNSSWAIVPANRRKIKNKIGLELFCSSQHIKLFRGETSPNKNRSGLLVTVKGRDGIIMLGGDHSNYQIWELMYHQIGVNNEEINAVAPHHGSPWCLKLKLPQVSNYGVVAISAGKDNDYIHPNSNVVTQYAVAGFTVKCTEQGPQTNTKTGNILINQKDITINL